MSFLHKDLQQYSKVYRYKSKHGIESRQSNRDYSRITLQIASNCRQQYVLNIHVCLTFANQSAEAAAQHQGGTGRRGAARGTEQQHAGAASWAAAGYQHCDTKNMITMNFGALVAPVHQQSLSTCINSFHPPQLRGAPVCTFEFVKW